MPTWRYAKFDAAAAAREERLRQLQRLLVELLLRTNGDVNEALAWLEQLGKRHGLFDGTLTMDDFKRWLEGERTVAKDAHGMLRLAPAGEKLMRASSLDEVFRALKRGEAGDHRVPASGEGGERLPETRPWSFGDALERLDGAGTIAAAIRRSGLDDFNLTEEDLSVFETEQHAACATVLLLDVSHSMVLYGEDRITPAKKVALALSELITTRYPKDTLDIIVFGDDAWQIEIKDLPYLQVGPYHTNTVAGLELAMDILRRRKNPNKQIFMITDGKPTCLKIGKRYYKNSFGLDRKITSRCLNIAAQCKKLKIPITTFMIATDPYLQRFVNEFTETNNGKAFFAALDKLGAFIFKDFESGKRKTVY